MGDIGMAEKSKQGPKSPDAQGAGPAREPEVRNAKLRVADPAGSGDQGPGTRQEEVAEDPIRRGQARMHIGDAHVAAPIEAPDASYQVDPPEGHARSSTNPVSALTGLQTYTGENHSRLTDENGNDVDAADLFEPHDEVATFRVVKQRVYEEFNYAGSLEPMTRLLFPAGHRVTLATAARMEHAAELGRAQKAQEVATVEDEKKRFFAAQPNQS
jgi:hypothetical protein